LQVIGEAFDEASTLRLTAELNPDVVVLGHSPPGLSGLQVMARLHETR
jgi:chemotaxis response regulator CheB